MKHYLIIALYGWIAAAVLNEHTLDENHDIICTSYTKLEAINNSTFTICSIQSNSTCHINITQFLFDAFACYKLDINGEARIFEDEDSIAAYLKKPRNYLISIVILIINVMGALAIIGWKLYQRKRKRSAIEKLSKSDIQLDKDGNFVIPNGTAEHDDLLHLTKVEKQQDIII